MTAERGISPRRCEHRAHPAVGTQLPRAHHAGPSIGIASSKVAPCYGCEQAVSVQP